MVGTRRSSILPAAAECADKPEAKKRSTPARKGRRSEISAEELKASPASTTKSGTPEPVHSKQVDKLKDEAGVKVLRSPRSPRVSKKDTANEIDSKETELAKKDQPECPSAATTRSKRVSESEPRPSTPSRAKRVSETEIRPVTPSRKSRRLSGSIPEYKDSPIVPLKKRKSSHTIEDEILNEEIKELRKEPGLDVIEENVKEVVESPTKKSPTKKSPTKKSPTKSTEVTESDIKTSNEAEHASVGSDDKMDVDKDELEHLEVSGESKSEIKSPKSSKSLEKVISSEDSSSYETADDGADKPVENVIDDSSKDEASAYETAEENVETDTSKKIEEKTRDNEDKVTNADTETQNTEDTTKTVESSEDTNTLKKAVDEDERKIFETIQNIILLNKIPRQKPKSGKFWKQERGQFRQIKKDKGQRKTFEERLRLKEEKQRNNELANMLKQEKNNKKEELRKRIEENKKLKAERQLKNEVFQIVKNPNKIKRMKKKDLAKRDILGKV